MWSVDVLSSDHLNLSTEHPEDTDFLSTEGRIFLVATLEILEEIFFKMLLTQEIYSITREPKSLNKNP